MQKNDNKAVLTQIKIGELNVNRMGLGTNRLTDNADTRQLLHHAVKIGIHFIDTADVYANHASETTIGNTLAPFATNLIVTTKGGFLPNFGGVNGRPDYLKQAVEKSLKRLNTSQIYLYQLHRVDPNVPLVESVGALKQLQKQGKIKHIGLSDVTIAQIKEAQQVANIVSVQNHYNLNERKHDPEIDYCEANNIVFIPWYPLAQGQLVQEKLLHELAIKYEATPQQLLLAWLLKRSSVVLPIPGTLSIAHLEMNAAATRIHLSDYDFKMMASGV